MATQIATTPAAPVTLTTRSGFALTVRAATLADAATIEALFEHVSPDDRRFRFLTACPHLTPSQIAALTEVDHWRTESYLAFGPEGSLVASAVLACDKDMDTAEVAISIRSDEKGKGIGWTLLDFVANEARRRGVKKLLSIESRENHSAIELEREMGFIAHELEGDPTVVVLEVRF